MHYLCHHEIDRCLSLSKLLVLHHSTVEISSLSTKHVGPFSDVHRWRPGWVGTGFGRHFPTGGKIRGLFVLGLCWLWSKRWGGVSCDILGGWPRTAGLLWTLLVPLLYCMHLSGAYIEGVSGVPETALFLYHQAGKCPFSNNLTILGYSRIC